MRPTSTRRALLLLLFGVCLQQQVQHAIGANPTPPVIAPVFSSTLHLAEAFNGSPQFLQLNGSLLYDRTLSAQVLSFDIELTLQGAVYRNIMNQFFTSNSSHLDMNLVCRSIPGQKFNDMFSWVQFSTYNGTAQINGRTTDVWLFTYPPQGLVLHLYSVGNVPVRFTEILEKPVQLNLIFDFYDVNTVTMDPSIFVPPARCYSDGFICEDNGVQEFNYYLYHPEDNFSLNNTNVADLVGDVIFTCADSQYDIFPFELLSQWKVQVNTTYGQYQLCNYGFCIGPNDVLVGREASDGMKLFAGQCNDNKDIGNWISLPEKTYCQSGWQVGDHGCTWKTVERVKTINGSCLFANGFASACLNASFSLDEAIMIYQRAFASDDPRDGGCPPLTPPAAAFEKTRALSARQHDVARTMLGKRTDVMQHVAYAMSAAADVVARF